MAAKKPAKVQEVVKKAKPQAKVHIPKFVSSSTDKFWRRRMITAIREQADNSRRINAAVKQVTSETE